MKKAFHMSLCKVPITISHRWKQKLTGLAEQKRFGKILKSSLNCEVQKTNMVLKMAYSSAVSVGEQVVCFVSLSELWLWTQIVPWPELVSKKKKKIMRKEKNWGKTQERVWGLLIYRFYLSDTVKSYDDFTSVFFIQPLVHYFCCRTSGFPRTKILQWQHWDV